MCICVYTILIYLLFFNFFCVNTNTYKISYTEKKRVSGPVFFCLTHFINSLQIEKAEVKN